VNAWAEWSALLAGPTIALLTTFVPALAGLPFGAKLALTAFGSLAIWLPVMLLTGPESPEVLESFYRKARPGGPGWRPVRGRVDVLPATALGADLAQGAAALAQVLGAMLALGGVVTGSTEWALGGMAALVAGTMGRRALRSAPG
jgi:SSS family solute:Na+ symporter